MLKFFSGLIFKFSLFSLCFWPVNISLNAAPQNHCLNYYPSDSSKPEDENASEPYRPRTEKYEDDPRCYILQQQLQQQLKKTVNGKDKAELFKPSAAEIEKENHKILQRFELKPQEREKLESNQFVVLPKISFNSFAYGYHEIYQSELPLFISMDSLQYALFQNQKFFLQTLERQIFMPDLEKILHTLRKTSDKLDKKFSTEVVADVKFYLDIALALLNPLKYTSCIERSEEAQTILSRITKGDGLLVQKIFGRERMIDFSYYQPRGHYSEQPLSDYFRASVWLSRLEFNLVSRSSRSSQPGDTPNPAETPHEALIALALSYLTLQSDAITRDSLNSLQKSWDLLAGQRLDVSFEFLQKWLLKNKNLDFRHAKEDQTFGKLKKHIGDAFQRDMITHYLPEGTEKLPVIFTFLGLRGNADFSATMQVINPQVPHKNDFDAIEAIALMGSEHSLKYLQTKQKKYPNYQKRLLNARNQLKKQLTKEQSLYSSFYKLSVALADPHAKVPAEISFAHKTAYKDFQINSAMAGFSQLKSAYVLMAAQSYDLGGCKIKSAFVEPNLQYLEQAISYSRHSIKIAQTLNPKRLKPVIDFYNRAISIYSILKDVVERELNNKPLTKDQVDFLGLVSEITPGGTGGPPMYTGWYFELFLNRADALNDPVLIADFHTSAKLNRISYAGTQYIHPAIFAVLQKGKKAYFSGPVISAFLAEGPVAKRFDKEYIERGGATSAPWNSFSADFNPSAPPIRLRFNVDEPYFGVLARNNLKPIEIVFLDHNRRPISSFTVPAYDGEKTFDLKFEELRNTEMLYIRQGEFQQWHEYTWTGLEIDFLPADEK